MNFEISREDLLKLKHSSYEMYQFVISQKSADGDYCETLDIEKLKKECELGYFKIEDLFTRKQLLDAYLSDYKQAYIGKVVSAETTIKPVFITEFVPPKDSDYYMKPASDFVQTDYVKKESPKKHQALKDFLDKHDDNAVAIKAINHEQFDVIQKILVDFGCKWRTGVSYVSDYKSFIFVNLFGFEPKTISYNDEEVSHQCKSVKYSFETEKFI